MKAGVSATFPMGLMILSTYIKPIVLIEAIIAVVFVVFVYAKFMKFIFAGPKPEK